MSEAIVGILGGMGPEATVELLRRIVARTPASGDNDHIRCIVDQNAKVPNRSAAIAGRIPSAGPVLANMAQKLEAYGADMLCMPCNTAHYYLDEIRAATSIPFVDMLECTARRVRALFPEAAKVAVLCTTGTRSSALYEKRLAAFGLEAVYPAPMEQEVVSAVIAAVKAGDTGAAVRQNLQQVIDHMRGQGMEAFIAACTELSVICPDRREQPWMVDALDALVDAIIDKVKGADMVDAANPALR